MSFTRSGELFLNTTLRNYKKAAKESSGNAEE